MNSVEKKECVGPTKLKPEAPVLVFTALSQYLHEAAEAVPLSSQVGLGLKRILWGRISTYPPPSAFSRFYP